MFKATLSVNTQTANTNIPMTVVKHTNGDVTYNASTNTIVFNTPGKYVVQFHAVATNVAVGDVNFTEYLNGVSSDYAISSATSTGLTELISFDIPDILSVAPVINVSTKATLSYQTDSACEIAAGVVTIFKL